MIFRSPILILLIAALVLGPWSFASSAFAQEQTLMLNHKRIQIRQLIQKVGEATNRTILVGDEVRGALSIVSKKPVTLDEAWTMLETALSLVGFSLLPSTEGNWRVARVADAVGEAPFRELLLGAGDSFVTTLIPLRIAHVEDVLDAIKPLAGTRVSLVPYPPSNSLIASGPERAIVRLVEVADALDQLDVQETRFRVIRHREVGELETFIEGYFLAGVLSNKNLSVWADERTNSIIYRGTDEQAKRLLELVEDIDRPVEGGGRLRILKVLYRSPEEMADLLLGLRDEAGGGSTEAISASSAVNARTLFTGRDYSIVADSGSRALIVRADPETHEGLRRVLEILDQQPQLIAVDLKVARLSTPRSYSLGFAFNLPLTAGDSADDVIGRFISTPAGAGLLAQPGPETTVFGRVSRDAGVPFTVDGGNGVEIPIEDTGVVAGGEFTAYSEVLIQPSLIVTAGEQHEIFVGDNVPVPVGSDSGIGDDSDISGRPIVSQQTTIERRDVGITLGIEATAGRVGKIQLALDVEISQVVPSLAGDVTEVGPTFAQQSLQVNATLDDGEIAILAVDQESTQVRGRSGTPWLSSIPFLGALFRQDVEREDDARLVISVQARRVSSPSELVADSIRRRLAFERENARRSALPPSGGTPYAVRVTTRSRREDADSIAESLVFRGYDAIVHEWKSRGVDYFDVYVREIDSLATAADVAAALAEEGWETDLVRLPTRS